MHSGSDDDTLPHYPPGCQQAMQCCCGMRAHALCVPSLCMRAPSEVLTDAHGQHARRRQTVEDFMHHKLVVTGASALVFCGIQCSAIILAVVLLRRARTRYYGSRQSEVDAVEQVFPRLKSYISPLPRQKYPPLPPPGCRHAHVATAASGLV